MEPLVFTPYLRPMVWGGRRLGDHLGKTLPTAQVYGEAWEISGHPLHVSTVAEGPFAGISLTTLCHRHGKALFGSHVPPIDDFPWLIKFLDCQDLLSIQVHPNDEQVTRLCGEKKGKTEAWVVLAAEPSSKIYAGLLPGIGEKDVRSHLATGTLEHCLHSFTPNVGDCLFLEAGTVHAVGGGVLIAEVQQCSDATFRLYDWNRMGTDGKPRPLHIEQALQCIDWSRGPIHAKPREPLPIPGFVKVEPLVGCRYFNLQRISGAGRLIGFSDRLSVGLVTRGRCKLRTQSGFEREFAMGEAVLIPASTPDPEWILSDSDLLHISLPG